MELEKVLLARRSVRKFTEEAVSEQDIDALMHAAMSGPSACNKTPWDFYVIRNPEKLEALRKASPFTRTIVAPLAIVVCGDLSRALAKDYAAFWVQDCSAATENILLRAVDLGLGGVWCGVHPQERIEKRVSDIVGLGEGIIPLNIIFIGHPAETPEARDQYKAEFVHFVD